MPSPKPLQPPLQQPSTEQHLARFDQRPFFEKALAYGIRHGILDTARLDAIQTEAPKGMVQIARYFGSEFLRPELEKARQRLVNLVSLNLEHSSAGNLHQAAQMLQTHSLLSRSKAAADMLKDLIAMPQSSHFGMFENTGFGDEHIPQLAQWSLRSWAEYQAERGKRQQVALLIDAARWFAERLELDTDTLQTAACDAEAIIRTGLLAFATRQTLLPDWVGFQKMVFALRKKAASVSMTLPRDLPADYLAAVETVRQSVLTDLPRILDSQQDVYALFKQTPAWLDRYFWLEDPLGEVDDYARSASSHWNKATAGHSDDSSLLTLFLCLATATPPKTLLTPKSAATLVRKIRKSGVQSDTVTHYIQSNAPVEYQSDYLQLWQDFWAEAQSTLHSDHDYALHDALALLRRECNVVAEE